MPTSDFRIWLNHPSTDSRLVRVEDKRRRRRPLGVSAIRFESVLCPEHVRTSGEAHREQLASHLWLAGLEALRCRNVCTAMRQSESQATLSAKAASTSLR